MMLVVRQARLWVACLIFLCAVPAWAQSQAGDLARALKLGEVIDILHGEGMSYADSIEREMLPGGGGDFWDRAVAQLYHAPSMEALLAATLEEEMTETQIADSLAFFETDRGQSILTYENAARAAMADSDIEDIARQADVDARAAGDTRLEQVERFVSANDLVDRNVVGALSSNFQFFRGLIEGGAFVMSEDEVLADVYGQEPEIR